MRNKFQPKPFKPTTDQVTLPSSADRLAVFRRLERAVDDKIVSVGKILDPRPRSLFSSSYNASLPDICTIGIRGRLISYLRSEFLPMVSAALLLELEDFHGTLTGGGGGGGGKSAGPSPASSPSRSPSSSSISSASTSATSSPPRTPRTPTDGGNSTARIKQPLECITLLIANMILLSKGNYDARVRSIFKAVFVEILMDLERPIHQDETEDEQKRRHLYFLKAETTSSSPALPDHPADAEEEAEEAEEKLRRTRLLLDRSPRQNATIHLEAIERAIATDILKDMLERAAKKKREEEEEAAAEQLRLKNAKRGSNVKETLLRGLQIGTVSVAVGALFAFTGGLAAPGLVAAITALHVVGTSVAFATLTTTTALASMFGVVGGGLAAYKMKQRTAGLYEWRIRKETCNTSSAASSAGAEDSVTIRGLHATVCVSGWLVDKCDFQRPFGIQPNDPAIADKTELLQRFFAFHDPAKVQFAGALLKANKKKEDDLWIGLARRYGRDPDHLLPFEPAKRSRRDETRVLTFETEATIDGMLKCHILEEKHAKRMEEIYETNTMLIKMEAMNSEMFANMDTEVLEALKDTSTHTPRTPVASVPMEADGTPGKTPAQIQLDQILKKMEDMNRECALATPNRSRRNSGSNFSDASSVVMSLPPPPTDVEKKGGDEKETIGAPEASDLPEAAELSAISSMNSDGTRSPHDENHVAMDSTDIDALDSEIFGQELSRKINSFVCENMASHDHWESQDSCSDSEHEVSPALQRAMEDIYHHQEEKKNDDDDVVDGSDHQIVASETNHHKDSEAHRAQEEQGGTDLMQKDAVSQVSETNKESNPEQPNAQNSPPETDTPTDKEDSSIVTKKPEEPNKYDHSLVVWDWLSTYGGELYTITWETDLLLKLCRVVSVLFLEISNQVSKAVLQQMIFVGALVSSVAIPSALVTCAGVIDDPYQIISFRSEKAGIELAHCLMQSDEHRPISLVGFSFGARVIFFCLLELARHQALWEEKRKLAEEDGDDDKDAKKSYWTRRSRRRRSGIDPADDVDYVREPASIVEDVVLVGLPRLIEIKEWVSAREIVGGRLINCYNKGDWLLSYMINIRCWNGISSTCGTHPIQNIEGVENFEVSAFASSHSRYQVAMPLILHEVAYGTPAQPAASDETPEDGTTPTPNINASGGDGKQQQQEQQQPLPAEPLATPVKGVETSPQQPEEGNDTSTNKGEGVVEDETAKPTDSSSEVRS